MSKIYDGEPAFPRNYNADGHNGMSLRDYVAVQAMTAFYSSFDARDAKTSRFDLEGDARLFFDIADAFLAARTNQGLNP